MMKIFFPKSKIIFGKEWLIKYAQDDEFFLQSVDTERISYHRIRIATFMYYGAEQFTA